MKNLYFSSQQNLVNVDLEKFTYLYIYIILEFMQFVIYLYIIFLKLYMKLLIFINNKHKYLNKYFKLIQKMTSLHKEKKIPRDQNLY